MASNYTPSTWATAVLRKLGYEPTPGAVQALTGWAKAEGGHWNNQARYNPLNTTQPEPGAGNTGAQGNIKVYRDWDQGIDATVRTLKNGRYGGILAGLRSGDSSAVANAIGSSPWGTSGALVRQTIDATPSTVPRATVTPRPASGTVTAATARGVDNSQLRRSMIANFLQQGGVKSASATGALASGWQAAQDVPGTPSTTQTPTTPAPVSTSTSASPARRAKVRADAIDAQHLPYEWGGGHAAKTSIHDAVPLDCSGAVSKVLGINPRVASQFEAWGQPGDGGDSGVTIYANDKHVLMRINGHFFGTSGTNPGGGAGWIKQQDISPDYLKGFTARHA